MNNIDWGIVLKIFGFLWQVEEIRGVIIPVMGGAIWLLAKKLRIEKIVKQLLKEGKEHTEITDKVAVTLDGVQKIAAKSEPDKKGFFKRFQRNFRKTVLRK